MRKGLQGALGFTLPVGILSSRWKVSAGGRYGSRRGSRRHELGGQTAVEGSLGNLVGTQRSKKVGRYGVHLSGWLYRGEVDSKVGK